MCSAKGINLRLLLRERGEREGEKKGGEKVKIYRLSRVVSLELITPESPKIKPPPPRDISCQQKRCEEPWKRLRWNE